MLVVLSGIGALATIYATSLTSMAFNTTSYDAAWSVVSLALGLTGLFTLLMRRPSIWNLSFAGFALIVAGYGFHMALGPSELAFGPYIRWGEIMGIPILILAALRSLLDTYVQPETPSTVDGPPPPEPEIPPVVENDIAQLPQVLIDLEAFSTASQLDQLTEIAVRTFSRAMKAELCILLTPPGDSGQLSIATGYDLISERHLDGRSLRSEDIPIIAQAMERKQSVDLPAGSQAPDVVGLQQALFLDRTGVAIYPYPSRYQIDTTAPRLMLPDVRLNAWCSKTPGSQISSSRQLIRPVTISPVSWKIIRWRAKRSSFSKMKYRG
jgi:hypothetical protein